MKFEINKNLLAAFFIGFTASLFTAIYLARGYNKAEHDGDNIVDKRLFRIEYMFPLIAVTLGLANVLNVYLKEQYKWLIGIAIGLIFSTYGISVGIHKAYFDLTELKARMIAIFYYSFIFGVLIASSNAKLQIVK